MKSIATILLAPTMSPPTRRSAARGLAAVALVTMLATSTGASANTDTPGLESEALTQIATDALSQGMTGPGTWESRAALIALGTAGLYLGASTGPDTHRERRATHRAQRLAWPAAGAALGKLIACKGGEAGPLLGAMTGALIAHVLDPETRPGRRDRTPGDAAPGMTWTPMITMSPGSFSVGLTGRF
jgi:hypothetical protein